MEPKVQANCAEIARRHKEQMKTCNDARTAREPQGTGTTQVPIEPVKGPPELTKIKKRTSLLASIVVATAICALLCIAMIIFGFLLTMTVIGAVIGIPMMGLGGIAIKSVWWWGPLLGAATYLFSRDGACPYCGSEVSAGIITRGFDCPVCKKRILVRDNRFERID